MRNIVEFSKNFGLLARNLPTSTKQLAFLFTNNYEKHRQTHEDLKIGSTTNCCTHHPNTKESYARQNQSLRQYHQKSTTITRLLSTLKQIHRSIHLTNHRTTQKTTQNYN
jgi:hypothetical protein